MTYGRTNFDLREARSLETLAFRFLGEKLTVHVNHRKGEQDIMNLDHIYPIPTGEALGYKVFIIDAAYIDDPFEGKVVAVLFDYGQEAGPLLVVSTAEKRPHRAEVLRQLGVEADFGKEQFKIYCLYDKSVGGVPYYLTDEGPEYLVIRSVLGHYCFPKGHMEAGESEEGTGLREIWEETGLQVELLPGFRYTVSYQIPPAYQKEVVYYLARFRSKEIKLQQAEVSEAVLLPYEAALAKLTYRNDQDLLRAAHRKIKEYYRI